jgi:hypothetical protein
MSIEENIFMPAIPEVLRPAYLTSGPFGDQMLAGLEGRVNAFEGWRQKQIENARQADQSGQKTLDELDVAFEGASVALISTDDKPHDIGRAIWGARQQLFVSDVEILLVNGGNESATLDKARKAGAKIVDVEVDASFHANMLNGAMDAAKYDHIFTMPGHGLMATNVALASGMRHLVHGVYGSQYPVGGVYGTALPDSNASWVEFAGGHYLGATERLNRSAAGRNGGMGFLDATCSMVDRRVIQQLGGYPKEFGNGGADGAMGKLMINGSAKERFLVIEDGALSVHHTHGFGVVQAARQALDWSRRGRPKDYDQSRAKYPGGGLC